MNSAGVTNITTLKKFAAFIFILLYLSTSSGFALTVHYCMGKAYSASFSSKNTCDKCGMHKTKGACCKDVSKIIKSSISEHQSVSYFSLAVPYAIVNNTWLIQNSGMPKVVSVPWPSQNSPPGLSSPIFVKNCVFRI